MADLVNLEDSLWEIWFIPQHKIAFKLKHFVVKNLDVGVICKSESLSSSSTLTVMVFNSVEHVDHTKDIDEFALWLFIQKGLAKQADESLLGKEWVVFVH